MIILMFASFTLRINDKQNVLSLLACIFWKTPLKNPKEEKDK